MCILVDGSVTCYRNLGSRSLRCVWVRGETGRQRFRWNATMFTTIRSHFDLPRTQPRTWEDCGDAPASSARCSLNDTCGL